MDIVNSCDQFEKFIWLIRHIKVEEGCKCNRFKWPLTLPKNGMAYKDKMANRVRKLLVVDWLHDRNITKSNGNWHQKRKELWIFLAITTKNGMNLLCLSWTTHQCYDHFMPMCILSPFMNKCKRWSWGHWNLKWKVEWVKEGKDAHNVNLSQKRTIQMQDNVGPFLHL